MCGAGRSVAVVVDAGGPAGVHLHAVESIGRRDSEVGPHWVLLVEQRGPSVVSDAVFDSVLPPGAKSVAVVQSRDGWWDYTVGSEMV